MISRTDLPTLPAGPCIEGHEMRGIEPKRAVTNTRRRHHDTSTGRAPKQAHRPAGRLRSPQLLPRAEIQRKHYATRPRHLPACAAHGTNHHAERHHQPRDRKATTKPKPLHEQSMTEPTPNRASPLSGQPTQARGVS